MIPVVLAGGSGTRFWPLSRQARPKQLLSLWDDDRSLIEATVHRLAESEQQRRVHIVCSDQMVEPTRRALAEPRQVEFICEPAPRNTAPAIAFATAVVEAQHGDEPIGFFPADHYIGDLSAFHRCVEFAAQRARGGAIMTLGIPPTRPETGYGYIETPSASADTTDQPRAYPVDQFVEKPDVDRAVEYLESGRFLWNSGMFLFQPSTLWAEFERQHPDMFTCIERIRDAVAEEGPQSDIAQAAFGDLEAISIDYAIMENARRVEVVPASFRWSDVGHWGALHEVMQTDENDNVVDADTILQDVSGCTIVSRNSSRLIAACGLEEIVIVDTEDALLVLPASRAQQVRDIVAELADLDRDDLL